MPGWQLLLPRVVISYCFELLCIGVDVFLRSKMADKGDTTNKEALALLQVRKDMPGCACGFLLPAMLTSSPSRTLLTLDIDALISL